MGQFNKAVDCRRVQNISGLRGVFLAVILAPVQAAHRAAAFANDQRAVCGFGKHLIAVENSLHQGKPLTGQFGVVLHHKTARRAGGVHSLVIQNDFHIQRGGSFDSRADIVEIGAAQIFYAGSQPHAGVQHNAENAVVSKVRQLTAQLGIGQIPVQKPKRDGGKFFGRVRKLFQ